MERPQSSQSPGATSLKYLAPSVVKVAISNRRIVGLQDRIVTFTSRKPGRARPRTIRLDVLEFMRRFLQHVLPAGFMKVRHCGFMNVTCRSTTDTIRPMITSQTGATPEQPQRTATTLAQVTCPNCGAPLIVLSRVWPLHMALLDTGEAHGLETSLTWPMLLWKETKDGTGASEARDNALQGPLGQASNGCQWHPIIRMESQKTAHREPSKPDHHASCLTHHLPFEAIPYRR